MEDIGYSIIPFFSGVMNKQSRKEDKSMVPILAILTVVTCMGITSIAQRVRRTPAAEERTMRRSQWRLTEEAFLKRLGEE